MKIAVRSCDQALKSDNACKREPQKYPFTVAANLLRDHVGTNEYRVLTNADSVEEALDARQFVVESSVEEEFAALQHSRLLREASQVLSAHDRELLDMVFMQGLSYRAIANIRGVTKTAVEKAVRKLLARCGQLLGVKASV